MTRSRTSTTSMSGSLARSSSISLVLPVVTSQQKRAFVCKLRRAQSDLICPVEYRVFSSSTHFGNGSSQEKGHQLEESRGNRDIAEQDSYCSDYTSCHSSIADFLDILDEPQRVSKEILRSVSLSFQWLEPPLHDFEPPSYSEGENNIMVSEQRGTFITAEAGNDNASSPQSIDRHESLRFAYVHDCRTGKHLATHVELKTAMDSLLHWNMKTPGNCVQKYLHDVTGEEATLPWPDLEAGGMEEIEEFVSIVNRVEGKPVFFSRYQRSAFEPTFSSCTFTGGHVILKT